MQTNNSSQCQLFRLQLDAFLDRELEESRNRELQGHVEQCADCARELAYAQQLHQAVLSLPVLDCSDEALEPVDRLFAADGRTAVSVSPATPTGFRAALNALWDAVPAPLRVGIPVAAVLLLTVGAGREFWQSTPPPEVAVQSSEPQYSEAEIVQALEDLELAMDYLGQISARTEVMIGDRFLRRQLEQSVRASFSPDQPEQDQDLNDDGPI